MSFNNRHSFTLIELLIVIGIIAIISVVVIVVLNPQELIKQARDSTRFSDMTVLERSLSIFEVDRSTSFAGTSTVVYVSVPDTSSTCANLGLPSLPSGWTYNCASTSTLQNVDGTGWIPANLTSISTGSPIDRLPIDPTNATSTGLYYTYVTGGSFHLATFIESNKFKMGGDKDRSSKDGGSYPELFEKGNDLSLLPVTRGELALIGYWRMDEGGGIDVFDSSGYNATGTIFNGATYSAGKVAQALLFDGINDYVQIDNISPNLTPGEVNTVAFWVNWKGGSSMPIRWNSNYDLWFQSASCFGFNTFNSGDVLGTSLTNVLNNWTHIVAVFYNGVPDSSNNELYINGEKVALATCAGTSHASRLASTNMQISSNSGHYLNGAIDDIRLYNRALSAT